jgi:heparosan-N-sulfate-glucuronate 5-epimerase
MSPSLLGTLDAPGGGGVPFPNRVLEPIRWLVRALWSEVFGFRFAYPIEMVPQAGPRHSLHYYVFSERLFFDTMQLDDAGVPLHRARTLGTFYNPAYVAWYGLMALEQSLRRGERQDKRFQVQVDWLLKNAVRRSDASVVWPFPVDVREGECFLEAPWVSAMTQGLVLSVLVRAHRMAIGGDSILPLARAALGVFFHRVEEGGVRTLEDGQVLYEEYPGYPLPRVLDGFLFSLLGQYDLWVETEDPLAQQLFQEGVAGLVSQIQFWNYKDRWTWYGSHGYLCPPHYHTLNRMLLAALGDATGESALASAARSWDPGRLSLTKQWCLFATFVLLKQWSRAKNLGAAC